MKIAEDYLKGAMLHESDSFNRFFKNAVVVAMEAYADQYRDKWISVERPPKDMDDVLVIDSGCIIGTAVYSSDKKLKYQKCWFNVHAQKWVDDITHWQPLPTPPKV